jgi:hypothetical protein
MPPSGNNHAARSGYTLLVLVVLAFVSLLLVASSLTGIKDSGKKWGAKMFVV